MVPRKQLITRETFVSPDYNTSKEGAIRLEQGKLTLADGYALVLSLVLLPFGILVWLLLTWIGLPCGALGKLYIMSQKRPVERFHGIGFNLFLTVCFPLFLLGGGIAWVWWAFVFTVSIVATFPVLVIRLLCGQCGVISKNLSLIRPFLSTGMLSYGSVARALLGQIDRQGLCEFFLRTPLFGGGASVVAWVPIIKHLWGANPFLYELELAYINQWSGPHPTLKPAELKERIQLMCCRALHEPTERMQLDGMRFAPHYPYGPSIGTTAGESVLGAQWLDINGNLMNFTVTTHVLDEETISTKSQLPIFKVYLNLFQFHFLTAYVEANVTDHGAVEHPQWAVVPKASSKARFGGGSLARMMFGFCTTLFVPYLKEVQTFTITAKEDGV